MDRPRISALDFHWPMDRTEEFDRLALCRGLLFGLVEHVLECLLGMYRFGLSSFRYNWCFVVIHRSRLIIDALRRSFL